MEALNGHSADMPERGARKVAEFGAAKAAHQLTKDQQQPGSRGVDTSRGARPDQAPVLPTTLRLARSMPALVVKGRSEGFAGAVGWMLPAAKWGEKTPNHLELGPCAGGKSACFTFTRERTATA
jgi:hypothetical protein